jgi:signal transduction histidine kinase
MKRRFDEPLESEFQRDYGEKSLASVRGGLLLGCLLYAAFLFVDYWALPETRTAAFRIRFFFAVPILLGAFLWSYHRSFTKRMQAKLTIVFITAASGITWILALSERGEPGYFVYSGGLVLAIMFTASLFRLQFRATAVASLTLFGSHTLVAILVQRMASAEADDLSIPVFVCNTFFLGSAVLVALMTAYTLEVYARRDFAQGKEIQAEKETTEGKNRELREALQALENAQSELVQSEKMAALGSLVSGLVHELASPVGVIRASADLSESAIARLEGSAEPPSRKLTDTLLAAHRASLQATERVSSILKSLRNFSRLDRSDFAVVDLHEGLEDAITLLASEFKSGITVRRRFGEVPKIACRPAELNQAFMHVLQNAVEAVSSPGMVTVETWSERDTVYVSVSDDGPGIDPEVMKVLFVPTFRRTGPRVKAGMGLFVSHQIVSKHGGRIQVASEPGRGTTVTIELPGSAPSGVA